MNTMQRRASATRFAAIAALLAAIIALCLACCFGTQQKAWATDEEEPLFKTGAISELPFNKSDNGITVNIAYDESDAEEPSGQDDADQNDKAKTITIEITVDDDVEADRIMIEADDTQIFKEIEGGKLEKDDLTTVTVKNCKELTGFAIYAPKAADNDAAQEDASNQDADANDQNADEPEATEPEGGNDAAQNPEDADANADKDANSDNSKTDIIVAISFTDKNDAPADTNEDDSGIVPASGDDENGESGNNGTTTTGEGSTPESGNTFSVEFIANGHGGDAPAKIDALSGSYVDLSGFTMSEEGYEFTGWYTDPECTQPFDYEYTPITGDTTLYAGWVKMCTVTFDLGKYGGTMAPIQVPQGQCIAQGVPTPEEPGFTFERWIMDDNETFVPSTTPVMQDMTVHAVWVQDVPIDQYSPIVVKRDNVTAATYDLAITKINIDDNTCLEGAEFSLSDKDGNVISTWTSGKSAVLVSGLRQDTTYVLTETKAPEGFGREKPININYVVENGVATVKIDQGGSVVVPLTNNKDGVPTLNVKDTQGKKTTSKTTMPLTGDSQGLPVTGIALGGAAACAAAVAIMAYRKRKMA